MRRYSGIRGLGEAELTDGERAVLGHLLKGLCNKEIAEKLGCSEKGVEYHLTNLYRKYHVASRLELVAKVLGEEDAARGLVAKR